MSQRPTYEQLADAMNFLDELDSKMNLEGQRSWDGEKTMIFKNGIWEIEKDEVCK